MNLSVYYENIKFSTFTIAFGIYFIILGIIYYLIFHKHHKRNKVGFDELVTLVPKFYSLAIVSSLIIIFGILCIIDANSYREDRSVVISQVLFGIVIISACIINFIFYIKRNLKDFDQEIRAENRKRTMKIGEVLELIFLIIFMLMPLWKIPSFIEIFDNKKELIIEILKSFVFTIVSIILIYNLNPLDIKEKINKLEKKK